jgi:hypothetical protein
MATKKFGEKEEETVKRQNTTLWLAWAHWRESQPHSSEFEPEAPQDLEASLAKTWLFEGHMSTALVQQVELCLPEYDVQVMILIPANLTIWKLGLFECN